MPRRYVLAARIVVSLAALVFCAVGVLFLLAGTDSGSWLLVASGAIVVLAALLLLWSAIRSNASDVDEAAVVLVANSLFGMFG